MPVTKNALIRYKTIDRCLRNTGREWTLNDLIEECSDALYDYTGRDESISRRTFQKDLNFMRSEEGYKAPIVVYNNKYYKYSDPEYSITESPLSSQEVEKLREAVNVLRQLSGFRDFSGMEDILGRLEDRVSVTEGTHPAIYFDRNDRLKGLEYIKPLHASILDRHPVRMTYKSFRAVEPSSFVFHPYALKEFNNRWFVYGRKAGGNYVLNLALDRVEALEKLPDEPFVEDPGFDPETWFDDLVGVTKSPEDRPQKIRFWSSADDAPYIRTKPFHASQMVVETNEDGSAVFQIEVIINRELVRLLFGHAEELKVLSPKSLRDEMERKFRQGLANYER